MIRNTILLLLAILMLPALVLAGPTIPGFYGTIAPALRTVPANALPQLKPGGLVYGASVPAPSANQLTIFQTQSQAIIDWSSFNIGSNASVYFNQQGNANWACLNRIWDNSPSQIYGHLTADGQIYLINQNGILFGPGSQVNVNGLVASSLNLSIDNFLAGTLHFSGIVNQQATMNNLPAAALQGTTIYVNAASQGDPFLAQYVSNVPGTTSNPGVVSNIGTITAGSGGSVFLIGPNVENAGTITAPSGQIGLIGATDVELNAPQDVYYPTAGNLSGSGFTDEERTALTITINNSPNGYTATNLAGGLLEADTGLVGMYGNIVNQNGVIQSVQGVQRGAHVELLASDSITTGPGSLISLPVSTSPDEINSTFITVQSDVYFGGLSSVSPTNMIVHQGSIVAPSALVSMNAANRVYLASGSQIDVSGLWLEEPASAGVFSVQMNTYNLRDYYVQQGGVLQGQTINISQLTGSSIGDVSGTLTDLSLTAAERHTQGGTISITTSAATSDIIERQGAVINFSGGGIVYAAGAVDTTQLVSGYEVYDISSASADVVYNSILNVQSFTNSRFGTTHTYDGVYYGGDVPVNEYSESYTVGSNAGTLWLQAPTVVLDGTILGSATNGFQQTLTASPVNEAGNVEADGYVTAMGGTLLIGNNTSGNSGSLSGDTLNFVTNSITVAAQAIPLLPASFQPTDPLPASLSTTISGVPVTQTILPAPTLTKAGLSTLSLSANTTITVQQGAQITLNPGGTFNATARRIENYGAITVPGGSINLSLQTNLTSNPISFNGVPTNPDYVPLDERVYLAPGSSLSAAGERIDETGASVYSGITTSGYINGGSIQILDQTVDGDGVIVSPGAIVDVSGGFQVSPKGKITGGNAGSLTLQGYTVMVDGDLRAQSLLGSNGGSIIITAGAVDVTAGPPSFPSGFNASTSIPESLVGKLVLGSSQLDDTGFTDITLTAVNDAVVESGATLAPSQVKLATPVLGGGAWSTAVAGPGTVLVTADLIGTSAITLSGGATVSNLVTGTSNPNGPMNPVVATSGGVQVLPGAGIVSGPGGAITLSGGYVTIDGYLNAPSGTIKATTGGTLTLGQGAAIYAEGYNQPGTTLLLSHLQPNATPKPGGTVTLSAGTLILSPDSLVSVNGSSPIQETVINSDGSLSSVTVAGQPGNISLAYSGSLSIGGNLEGRAMMAGLPGGSLSITNTNQAGTLALSMSELEGYQMAGFDALTLASAYQLSLTGSGQVSFGRKLTLDAPLITGFGTDEISLAAPWVQVQAEAVAASGNPTLPATSVLSPGSASITLAGGFVDVTGYVLFSGFNNVTLAAADDIRLNDFYYTSWAGLLATSGDLTLQAARIYPTTQSAFSITANGKVTILPSGTPVSGLGPIFSAGGNLAITSYGAGIDQEGYLAAPMGAISLNAPNGRVYLGSGSTTTTEGEAAVEYGFIESGESPGDLGFYAWASVNHFGNNQTATLFQSLPTQSVSLQGSEVVVREGATIDVSGGGTVFSSLFIPSYSGTNNPLAGSYVILPGNSVAMPGSAVYLVGIKGLPAGTYSLLPALDSSGNPTAYVYMPGALIVTDLGRSIASSFNQALTADGYPIVPGYATTMGTNIYSAQYEAYEVRPASVVLAEGQFNVQSFTAGNGGTVSINAQTVVLNGTIKAGGLPTYSGGSVALSAGNVLVLSAEQPGAFLPSDFTFSTPISGNPDPTIANLANTLTDSSFSPGFQTIGLGVSSLSGTAGSVAATSVDIEPGATVQAENTILGAKTSITLEQGAQVLALASPGDTGQATFLTPGLLSIGANVVVHASDAVNLEVGNLSLDPTATVKADHSNLNLVNSTITIMGSQATSSGSPSGLYLTVGQWNSLASSFDDISLSTVDLSVPLAPQSGTVVFDDVTAADSLAAVKDTLTLDTGLVTTRMNGNDTGSVLTLAAQTIVLQNTSGASALVTPSKGTGSITLQAQGMEVGNGTTYFDGFGTVNMNAAGGLTFRGAGALGTGGANLNISAPQVTTAQYMQPAGTDPSTGAVLPPVYTAADFAINAGSGTVTIAASGGAPGTAPTPGGTLAVSAGEIDISTVIDVPSGQIDLTATKTAGSTGNITIGSGGQLLAQATPYAPGGAVSLTSTPMSTSAGAVGGTITIASGAVIDVSAYQGSEGDAGSVSLYAPFNAATNTGGVVLASGSSVLGHAYGGQGGSLSMVTGSLAATSPGTDFFSTAGALASGGFTGTVNIEATAGDAIIASGDTVQAGNLAISADTGSLGVYGTINASGSTGGGTVGLYASNNLTVGSAAQINAYGTAGSPANVTLSVAGGSGTTTGLTLAGAAGGAPGGTIDITNGGTVTFQAPVTSNGAPVNFANLTQVTQGQNYGLNMALNGSVNGASNIVVDEVNTYSYSQSGGLTISTGSPSQVNVQISTVQNNTTNFMSYYGGSLLQGSTPPGVVFQPGVLIENTAGNITLSSPWNLTSWRPGSVPGALTLRASGNLNIDGSLYDAPTSISNLSSGHTAPSWNINLVAGANGASANPMAVNEAGAPNPASGNLTVAKSTTVYTESGLIDFASGGNAVINDPTGPTFTIPHSYNIGTFSGSIFGEVQGDLTLNSGAIQTATGNINIDVGGNLTLGQSSTSSAYGSIRTTGSPVYGKPTTYSAYSGGGSISLDVGGDVVGQVLSSGAWLTVTSTFNGVGDTYTVLPIFGSNPTQGIVTLAGGNVSVRAGGAIEAQLGTFGAGNLAVYAGGDLEGRFLVNDGMGSLNAMGNFGVPNQVVNGVLTSWPQLIEMANAQVSVTAQGNVEVGAVVNPTLALGVATSAWDMGYTLASSVSLTAVTGDVNLYGSVDPNHYGSTYALSEGPNTRILLLPASVSISAGGNINIPAETVFTQLPAPDGELSMTAAANIVCGSGSGWIMSDADPATVYLSTNNAPDLNSHSSTPVHAGDATPVAIFAGGDIEDMAITVPKAATIVADGNITDLNFFGQNIQPSDVTTIAAQGNILYGYSTDAVQEGILLAGPGYLVVQAGGRIDLGESEGIQEVGNYTNPALKNASGSVIVTAGFTDILGAEGIPGVSDFFEALRAAGDAYTPLLQTDPAGALAIIDEARASVIAPFLASHGAGGSGDISMTYSQISTAGGGSISLVATGSVDVGTTTLGSFNNVTIGNVQKNFGILTEAGGAINLFSIGDVNVNESRIMTFAGGDITMWSDRGNIYAGIGDKATVNATTPEYVCSISGVCTLVFSPPAVGSGIRALSYTVDPNTPAPPIGNLYIFAPAGVINAGEAGISGGNLTLGAMNGVLNAANVSFTGQAVGLPPAQGVNLGALTGVTNLSATGGVSTVTAALETSGERVTSAQPIEDIVLRWVNVQVIDVDWSRGVVGGEEEGGQPEERRDQKRGK